MALLFDRLLLDTDVRTLRATLRELVQESNERGTSRTHELVWPLDNMNTALDAVATSPEGSRQWNGLGPTASFGAERIALGLVWWADHLGRRHVRVRTEHH